MKYYVYSTEYMIINETTFKINYVNIIDINLLNVTFRSLVNAICTILI